MAEWDTGPFENDLARAWVREFMENPGPDSLRDALDLVVAPDTDEVLGLSACALGIAAAAVVAAMRGGSGGFGLPEPIAGWLAGPGKGVRPDARLVEKAARAVERVRVSSHLSLLWGDDEDAAAWQSELRVLAERLAT